MIHTSITQNCTVFLLRVSRRGKKKTTQFRGVFVWIIVFYFQNIFPTNAFYNKQLQVKYQLDLSKAMCSFKP